MKNKKIHSFYIKSLALSLPFLMLIAYYFIRDPFMVARDYEDYDHSPVMQNEGFTSWKKYKLHRDSMRYDSFIMGNSCTRAYDCDEWNKHIHGRPYRMFCNNMGLGNLYQVLQALDRQPGQEIRNLLIVFDRTSFANHNVIEDAMQIMPEEVSNRSWGKIQITFLQAFLTPKIMNPYLKYSMTGEVTSAMKDVITQTCPTRTTYTNDAILAAEDSIRDKGEAYWKGMGWTNIKEKPRHVGHQLLRAPHMRILKHIRAICDRRKTRLRLVIGPGTDRTCMNPKDMALLKSILGKDCVFDYTGDNPWTDYHYFYDFCHYRKIVGRGIMNEIYRPV